MRLIAGLFGEGEPIPTCLLHGSHVSIVRVRTRLAGLQAWCQVEAMTKIEHELERLLRPNVEASARRGARVLLTRREAAARLGCRSWDLSLMAARGALSIQREVMIRERVPLEDVERLLAERNRAEGGGGGVQS